MHLKTLSNDKILYKKHSFIKQSSKYISNTILYDYKNDYYNLLDVEKKFKTEDIKKKFYDLAKKHHPDKGGDPEKFKQINNAYEVLQDPNNREVYDKLRDEHLNIKMTQAEKRAQRNYKENYSNVNNFHENYNKKTSGKSNSKQYYNFYNQDFNEQKGYYNNSYQWTANKNKEYNYHHEYYHNSSYNTHETEKNKENTNNERSQWEEEIFNYIFRDKYNYKNLDDVYFNKFKVNRKYTKIEKDYGKFLPDIKNRHHIDNRKKNYVSLLDSLKISNNTVDEFKLVKKGKLNPFEIKNEFLKDNDFNDLLHKITLTEDNEHLNKKLEFKQIWKVYSTKAKICGFLALGSLCIVINFYFMI